MNTQLNVVEKGGDTVVFDVENTKPSFMNGLRRTILSDVETVGFYTEDYNTSSLRVLKNTSSLHNEFLLHRLSLIPIYIPDTQSFNSDRYYFTLKVQNTSVQPLNVTTDDFKILDKTNNVEVKPTTLFPHDPITNDPILITRLKSNPGSEGEMIHIEGTCIKGSGKDNASFSPVSCAVFTNKIDDEKVEKELEKYLSEKEGIKEELVRKFMIEEKERHFHVDEDGNPDQFRFTVESIGILPPNVILTRALDILSFKLTMFETEIKKVMDGLESEIVSVEKANVVMDAYDIYIQNENHTLGNFLQEYIRDFGDQYKVKFVGYMNPHPLQKMIVLRIALNSVDVTKNDIITEVLDVTRRMKAMITHLREKIVRELGSDDMPAQKPKKKVIIKKKKKSTKAQE